MSVSDPQRGSNATSVPRILGWFTVVLCTAIGAFWAFWGTLENFHEGWYHRTLIDNLRLMLIQYLGFPIAFVVFGIVGVRWPWVGAALCGIAAVAAGSFFRSGAGVVLIAVPLAILGLGFWFGRPRPRRWAYRLIGGVPLVVMLGFGIPNAVRVAGRIDDGDLGMRVVPGYGVALTWAPRGPGWPDGGGATWHEALDACARLDRDGMTLAAAPQGSWRLPTIDEAVRSQVRHGENAGGQWDPDTGEATYTVQPDKESPLWDIHSQVIYWWTATEVDAQRAYRITYNGGVHAWLKAQHPDYLTFRCVQTE